MRAEDILFVISTLQEANVIVCIVGELALNYYNVPRVVHDLELCVPESDLKKAVKTLEVSNALFVHNDLHEYNLYTEYKRGLPRFRVRAEPAFNIVLFPDTLSRLAPLNEIIVSHTSITSSEYSEEILDAMDVKDLVNLPLPRFTPFFKGLCSVYVERKQDTAAIAAESLVDGMNLDEAWCLDHFSDAEGLQFALRLVAGKQSRIADFSPNEVTCFIANQEEAQRVLQIPGFA